MALKDALVNGVFQTIGSDHCSFTFNDQKLKRVGMTLPEFLEVFLELKNGVSLLYDVLVNQCNMSCRFYEIS